MTKLEPLLADFLLTFARAAAKDRGAKLTTISRRANGDSPFFDQLAKGKVSFTARKFDEMMVWFMDDANWIDPARRPALPVWAEALPKRRGRR